MLYDSFLMLIPLDMSARAFLQERAYERRPSYSGLLCVHLLQRLRPPHRSPFYKDKLNTGHTGPHGPLNYLGF